LYNELFITDNDTITSINTCKDCEVFLLKIIEIGLILEFLITSDFAALLSISKKMICSKGITPLLIEKGIVKGISNNNVSKYSIRRSLFISNCFPLFPWALNDMRQVFMIFKSLPCCFDINKPFMPQLSYSSLTTPYQRPVITNLYCDDNDHDDDGDPPISYEESQTMQVFTRSYEGKVISFIFQAYPSLIVEDDDLCDEMMNLICHLPKDKDYCIETGLCEKCNRYRCSTCFDLTYCEECGELLCNNCATCKHCDSCEMVYCSSCSDFTSCYKCENQCCDNCNEEFLHLCSHCEKILCSTCQDNGLIRFCDDCELLYCTDCVEHCVESCDVCQNSYCKQCRVTSSCDDCFQSFCSECLDSVKCRNCNYTTCSECFPVCEIAHCSKCDEFNCFDCKPFFKCKKCMLVYCINCSLAAVCSYCNESYCTDCELLSICINTTCHKKVCYSCRNSNERCQTCRAPLIIIPDNIQCRQS